jgi:ketosteroid isomerase-like protein
MAPDAVWEIREVLASDDRLVAFTFTISGTSVVGGGRFEIASGMVAVIENALLSGADQYESDDRQAMISRFTELRGGMGPLGGHPSERWVAEWILRWAARDVDGLMELYVDDFRHIDHRKLGWGETGKAEQRALFESFFVSASDSWWQVGEVLACDDRVVALTATLHGRNETGGGSFEIGFGVVGVIENGLRSVEDFYEPADRQAMLARYVELGGRHEVLGDRPPERFLATWLRHFVDRDLYGVVELYAADHVMVDHRTLAWEELGKDGLREFFESLLAVSPEARYVVDEVLACDDRVIAFTATISGLHVDGGGSFEIAYGMVTVIENSRMHRADLYQPEDRQAMLVRFAELGGGMAPLGDRPPEQHVGEWLRRWAAGDVDALMDLHADDYRRFDHRKLGWGETEAAEQRALFESFFASASDLWWQSGEVLACDDRVIALTFVLHGNNNDGGGAFEIGSGMVMAIGNGCRCLEHIYEPEDRQAMLARFAEMGGRRTVLGDRPPERNLAEYHRRCNERDLEGVLELFPPDYLLVDHRAVGWGESGKDEIVARHESFFALASDVRIEVDEVLACDDRVIAATQALRGTADDFGGSFELAFGIVAVIEDGLRVREDGYEPEDRQAMLVRFAELGGGQGPLGDRSPEQWASAFARRWAARDVGGLMELYADDHLMVDHRGLSRDTKDRDDVRAGFESFFAVSSDLWGEITDVIACDDRVIALSIIIHGASNDGGGRFEIAHGAIAVIEDGRMTSGELYESDDRQAMLARFAELGGAVSLGNGAPVREP